MSKIVEEVLAANASYVWHCHILEHEDSEMMRPYFVGDGD